MTITSLDRTNKEPKCNIELNGDELIQIHNALFTMIQDLNQKQSLLLPSYNNLFKRWDSLLNIVCYGKITPSNPLKEKINVDEAFKIVKELLPSNEVNEELNKRKESN